jgi:hypothetical protein
LLRFLIKLKTAKALGLTDPAGTLLGVADEVINEIFRRQLPAQTRSANARH